MLFLFFSPIKEIRNERSLRLGFVIVVVTAAAVAAGDVYWLVFCRPPAKTPTQVKPRLWILLVALRQSGAGRCPFVQAWSLRHATYAPDALSGSD